MATAVQVAELFGKLGLRIDKGAWERADGMLARTQLSLTSIAKLAVGALAGFSAGTAIKQGIAFNSTMEDTRNQIAGMLSLAKHTDLAAQFGDADKLMGSLQERAKKLPGSLTDYTNVLGMIAQPITDAGIGLKDLEDITVGTAVAAKAMKVDLEAGARDVNQAIMGQFHATDQLTGRILGSLGYIGEEGRKRFNELSKAQRAAVLKEALTQKQLAQLADAASKSASGRWDTFKAQLQETLGRVAKPLFERLSKLLAGVNGWLEKNGDAVERVADAIGGALATGFDLLGKAFAFLTSGGDEANAVLIGIGAAIATVVVPALLAMAAGWIIALAPILLVVAGVAAVAYGIMKLIKNWATVKRVSLATWEAIKNKTLEVVGMLAGAPGEILEAFVGIGSKIIATFEAAFDWIMRKAEEVVDYVKSLPGKIGDAFVGDLFSGLPGGGLLPSGASPFSSPEQFQSAPSYTAPTGSTSVKNVSVGPTTFNIDASGMTPEQAREAVGSAFDERLRDHLRAED